MPRRELRWDFDNLGDADAVYSPSVDSVDTPAVTPAIYLFDLVDGIARHPLGEVDAIVYIHAIQAPAVTPLCAGALYGDDTHLRGAGGEGVAYQRHGYDHKERLPPA